MSVISEVEAVAGGAVSVATTAANPIWLYAKIGGVVVVGAALSYLGYRAVSFVEQAAQDHASVATLTSQVGELKGVNAANEVAFKAKLAKDTVVVVKTSKLQDDLTALRAQTATQRKGLRNGPSTSGYKPTPDDQRFLDGLRKQTH
jgi:hypothetical protein